MRRTPITSSIWVRSKRFTPNGEKVLTVAANTSSRTVALATRWVSSGLADRSSVPNLNHHGWHPCRSDSRGIDQDHIDVRQVVQRRLQLLGVVNDGQRQVHDPATRESMPLAPIRKRSRLIRPVRFFSTVLAMPGQFGHHRGFSPAARPTTAMVFCVCGQIAIKGFGDQMGCHPRGSRQLWPLVLPPGLFGFRRFTWPGIMRSCIGASVSVISLVCAGDPCRRLIPMKARAFGKMGVMV
jgi:hypothetical protein